MKSFFLVEKSKFFWLGLSLILGYLFLTKPLFALTIEEVKAPIEGLTTEIFAGWMKVMQIAAVTSGIVMSVFRGSLTPVGIEADLAIGIHLHDSYLGTGAAGTLI